MMMLIRTLVALCLLVAWNAPVCAGAAPSSSLLARPPASNPQAESRENSHALRQMSMFAVAPPEPRRFQRHDLVQVIVREQSQARSSQELDADKRYRLDGGIARFPRFSLADLLQLQIDAGRTTDMPELSVDMRKGFSGDGDYRRRDDLSARITAEVIDVLPNGNLILEARTLIKTDREEAVMRVTGVCRPDDVTAANTILSNQLHNLNIEKMHKGELRTAAEKGIIARALDAVFAF